MFFARFPSTRLRRLRQNPVIRDLVRHTRLSPQSLILPLFARPGFKVRQPIPSMPGQVQFSVDLIAEEAREVKSLGIGAVILFAIPGHKDAVGSDAYYDRGIVQQSIRAIKEAVPDLLVITDVCFCEYTDHGHCGVVNDKTGRFDVDNDATLDLLVKQAVNHAKAGADVIAPSGMMDGMVGALRTGLDAAGYSHLPIISYAVKYASAYYGPFRDAVESAPKFGDRRAYQMDPAAAAEQALREAQLDIAEGADVIMVKPALAYLDILRLLSERLPGVPLAAYNVSGEYSMIKAAAEKGWIDEQAIVVETLTAIQRAGAEMVLTYFAKDLARWLA